MVVAFALVALTGATMAAAADASPVWKFNGTELSGKETVVGAAVSSSLKIPGATTICEHFLYNLKIENKAGKGEGELTELPLFECKVEPATCTVTSIEAEKLPWPVHLATFSTKEYLIVEKASVGIVYGGEECAVGGTKVVVSGSAGGLVENSNQRATFDKATFEATGTALKVGSGTIEWNGVFPTEAFESHREQALEG